MLLLDLKHSGKLCEDLIIRGSNDGSRSCDFTAHMCTGMILSNYKLFVNPLFKLISIDICVYSIGQPRERGVIADAVSKLHLPYNGADIPNLPNERPVTGKDWAHAALIEAGLVDGLDPASRIH